MHIKAQNILFLLPPKIKKPSFPISHYNCRSQFLNPSLYLNKDNSLPTKPIENFASSTFPRLRATHSWEESLAEPSTHCPLSVLQIMEICVFFKKLSFDVLCHFSHTASAESVSKSKKEETGRFLLEISSLEVSFLIMALGWFLRSTPANGMNLPAGCPAHHPQRNSVAIPPHSVP